MPNPEMFPYFKRSISAENWVHLKTFQLNNWASNWFYQHLNSWYHFECQIVFSESFTDGQIDQNPRRTDDYNFRSNEHPDLGMKIQKNPFSQALLMSCNSVNRTFARQSDIPLFSRCNPLSNPNGPLSPFHPLESNQANYCIPLSWTKQRRRTIKVLRISRKEKRAVLRASC